MSLKICCSSLIVVSLLIVTVWSTSTVYIHDDNGQLLFGKSLLISFSLRLAITNTPLKRTLCFVRRLCSPSLSGKNFDIALYRKGPNDLRTNASFEVGGKMRFSVWFFRALTPLFVVVVGNMTVSGRLSAPSISASQCTLGAVSANTAAVSGAVTAASVTATGVFCS